jgi:energy-coupling factor transporter ATP-binding protein EcfA2
MKAAEDVFEVLDRAVPARGCRHDVPDPSTSPLQIDQLDVCYPDRTLPALRDVSLFVEPGEVVAIAGPSGCGKSTLLGVLLGLIPASRGSVTVGGVDLADLDPDFPRVMVSTTNSAYNLTVSNSASPSYSLRVMTVVAAIFFPIILLYQGWSLYIFRKRISGGPPSVVAAPVERGDAPPTPPASPTRTPITAAGE